MIDITKLKANTLYFDSGQDIFILILEVSGDKYSSILIDFVEYDDGDKQVYMTNTILDIYDDGDHIYLSSEETGEMIVRTNIRETNANHNKTVIDIVFN